MVARGSDAVLLEGARLPPRLRDLVDGPERLYLHGELPQGPAVAIVGTREASPEGTAFTRQLAADLAAEGVAVLSGGAEGIDTAAHEGALDVAGVTVVVAPAGIDHPFPATNRELFHRVIQSGGAYLSLFPDDVAANRPIFFARNACMVALAHAVVVTEVPRRQSGAKNAAKYARALGRPLFVVPHSPWHQPGAGHIQELRLGAQPLDRAGDVLKLLRASGLHALGRGGPAPEQLPLPVSGMDPVLEALKAGAQHPDEIAERTGLSLATVQQRILTLTLSGVLVPGPWGSLKLVTS
jgi:DNA processing protein